MLLVRLANHAEHGYDWRHGIDNSSTAKMQLIGVAHFCILHNYNTEWELAATIVSALTMFEKKKRKKERKTEMKSNASRGPHISPHNWNASKHLEEHTMFIHAHTRVDQFVLGEENWVDFSGIRIRETILRNFARGTIALSCFFSPREGEETSVLGHFNPFEEPQSSPNVWLISTNFWLRIRQCFRDTSKRFP